MTTLPGPTGPLPLDWHRISWRRDGFAHTMPPFYVVTEDVTAVTMLQISLEHDPKVDWIKLESWSDFPASTIPGFDTETMT